MGVACQQHFSYNLVIKFGSVKSPYDSLHEIPSQSIVTVVSPFKSLMDVTRPLDFLVVE